MAAFGIEATVLTPFYYHGLYVPDGSATHPAVITDTALVFGLQALFRGIDWRPPRPIPDYRADLARIPWRASLLHGEHNESLPPVRHTVDLSREGGYTEKIQHNIGSGNYKNTFFVHEVAAGARYSGLLCGPNPFEALGTDELILRIGVNRLGMLQLRPTETPSEVFLNTATARLFGRQLPEWYRIIDTIRLSRPMNADTAVNELGSWTIDFDPV